MSFERERVIVKAANEPQDFAGFEARRLTVARRWWRWQLVIDDEVRHKGLTRADAAELAARLSRFLEHQQTLEEARAKEAHIAALRDAAASDLTRAVAWHSKVISRFDLGTSLQRWVPHDDVAALVSERPDSPALRALVSANRATTFLSAPESAAITALNQDLEQQRKKVNGQILRQELTSQRDFFDSIEKSPLTREQATAVVTFDNRVQVIAAAGSGKTSVMVARAAYAVSRGFIPPNRVLLLAYNANAAAELKERINTRLNANGIDPSGLDASTFHSFGLGLIGKATGTKPRLAPWVDDGKDVAMIERIVDELRDSSRTFRYKWDLYRLLFARTGTTPEGGDAEWWDPQTKVVGHRTLQGETVRSQGEKLIADWLFLNGVNYEYERAYEHPVADAAHAQYRPDFFYPDVNIWHEHWAIGSDGKPPEQFVGYAEGMAWKKQVHREYGTTLIETTWAEILDRSGFEGLETALRRQGLALDWNPDRPIPGGKPVEHKDLAKLVRTFMSHIKSNSLDPSALADRISRGTSGANRYRARLFLDIYWEIHAAWEDRLRAEGFVDFEDMLVLAAEALEDGRATAEHDLILVDEFQDSSSGRARLVNALVRGQGKYLLAVGDDWQSIYRFAGADISVMTEFEQIFGPSETVRLQTTFRSTQEITDAASAFVSRNPRQLSKQVTAAQGHGGVPITLTTVAASNPNRPDPELRSAVRDYLDELALRIQRGEIAPGADGKVTVDILGRYGFERKLLPDRYPEGLSVTFRTVHGSKGLESDYVLLPRLVRGTLGFPSEIEDDPVLGLVMADPDPYPHGEERRLLYVALTRARREVRILTVSGKESPFVIELLKDGWLIADQSSGRTQLAVCPRCGQGVLIKKTSRYGRDFYSCGRFPACEFTQSDAPSREGMPPRMPRDISGAQSEPISPITSRNNTQPRLSDRPNTTTPPAKVPHSVPPRTPSRIETDQVLAPARPAVVATDPADPPDRAGVMDPAEYVREVMRIVKIWQRASGQKLTMPEIHVLRRDELLPDLLAVPGDELFQAAARMTSPNVRLSEWLNMVARLRSEAELAEHRKQAERAELEARHAVARHKALQEFARPGEDLDVAAERMADERRQRAEAQAKQWRLNRGFSRETER